MSVSPTIDRTDRTRVVTIPAGKYWAGDPGYVVPNDNWLQWLDDAYDGDDGCHVPILEAPVGGAFVLGFQTAHGDGCYLGSDGNEYPVDAGLIGVTDYRFNPTFPEGVHEITFETDVQAHYRDGVITLGHLTIDTDPYRDDDDD